MLDKLIHIAHTAGNEIMKHYGQTHATLKADDSPVTHADHASNHIITHMLRRYFQGTLIVSEESPLPSHALPRQYFLVDPLDGTKEFLAQNGQFVVSIGFVEDGYPSLGVLYAPILHKTFVGSKDGAFCNGKPVRVRPADLTLTLVQSLQKSVMPTLPSTMKPIENIIKHGSAYKFALIASGQADVYPRTEPLKEWDTCAGQAIVEAAGGSVLDLTTMQRLAYGKKDFTHQGFLACGTDIFI